ncbi:glutathione S-transferase family protein [Luteimonas sp. RD2P54]|uniref:Glutathione S-transferase family protein n=1 Tax=Luteimonas endophytica TaxID=3042023 RepID=A0ABT6JAW9_9GAMM|nr:glutathione S-transferase family protein [Luteimonas endophytica]MDH5823981.1 glutathione S-transferase family protein [Luteimonas endophytica]
MKPATSPIPPGTDDPPRPELALYAESFAPWCERARWALDHHRVGYRTVEHLPLVGEPGLRWRSRRWRGRVSVPYLHGPGVRLMDSVEIARYAEARGTGAALFPADHQALIDGWIARSERLMQAGRSRVLGSGRDALEALREVGPAVPAMLSPARDTALVAAARHLARKYNTQSTPEQNLQTARKGLAELRDGLSAGSPYLVGGRFTFADVAMACALQFILPVADHHMRIGPATRRLWSWSELLTEAGPCLAWRDQIYRVHRLE